MDEKSDIDLDEFISIAAFLRKCMETESDEAIGRKLKDIYNFGYEAGSEHDY